MAKDNIGRDVGGGMNSQELKELLVSLAQGKVGKAKPFNKTSSNKKDDTGDSKLSAKFDDLAKILQDFIKNFKVGSKKKPKTQDDKARVSADKSMLKLANKGLKKGSIYTHDIYLEKAARLNNLELKALRLEMKAGKSSSEDALLAKTLTEISAGNDWIEKYLSSKPGHSGGEGAEHSPEEIEAENRHKRKSKISHVKNKMDDHLEDVREALIPLELMKKLGNAAGDLQKTIYGFRGTEVVFDGLLDKEREFTINVRQIAHEISGVTGASHDLQKSFENMGETAKITGFDRTKSQTAYLGNLKKGFKDQKLALAASKTQLNTERLIGVEAGSLGDTFSDMSLQMNMNNAQMSEFGRGVQEVARNTGVTGDALAGAVKSSESIIKNMRNFSTLTSESASNIVGVMASAEKFGAGEFASNLFGTLTQGMSGFMNANKETQSLIVGALGGNAKLLEANRNGTLLQTKEGIKGLADGMDNLIARFSGGQAKNIKEFEKLDAGTKSRINTSMKTYAGGTVAEMGQVTKAMNEQLTPVSEKLRKIGEQKLKNISFEKEAALIDEERTLKANTAMNALTKLDEQLKKSGDGAEGMKKALSDMDLSGFKDDLKAIGIDSKDAGGAMRGALEASLKGVNEGLKKAGKKGLSLGANDITKALKDPKEFENIRSQINEGMQELAVANKNAADPMTKLRTSLEQLNATLRGATQSAISTMMNSIFGKSLGFITTLADVGGQFAGFVFDSVLQYAQLGASLAVMSMQMATLGISAKSSIISIWGQITAQIAAIPALWASAGGFAGVAVAAWTLVAPLLVIPAIIAAIVAPIMLLYGTFSQASKSGEKAGAIFGKSMKDVTTAEYYAAKGAGFLTGGLNTLTFGIFDSWIGAEGAITKGLAQFNKMIPIMSVLMMVFDAIGGAIYGIGRSIVDMLIAPFEMLYYIWEPIGEVFTTIGNAVSSALGPLFGFSTTLSETGTVFTMFSNIFAGFGKVFRGVFRVIGQTIGFLIRIVTTVLNPVITLVGKTIGGVASIIGTVFKSIFDWFMGAFKVLEGIFTLDFSKIGSGLWSMINAAYIQIPKAILGIFTFAFKLLYIQIPQAVISVFWYAFKLLYIQLPRFLMGIPKMIFDAIWSGLTSLASNDWVGPIFQPFLDILQPFKDAWDSLYSALDELWKAVNLLLEPVYFLFDAIGSLFSSSESAGESMGFLKSVIYGISSVIGFLIKVALFPIQLMFKGLALMLQPVIWYIKLLTSAVSFLIKPLWSVVGTLLNDFVSAISYVGEVISAVVGFISAPFKWLYDFFSSMPEKLFNTLYSAASSVGLGWLFDSISGTSGGKVPETKAPTEVAEAAAAVAQPKIEIDEKSFNRIFGAAKTQEMLSKQELGYTATNVNKKERFSATQQAEAALPLPSGLLGGLYDELTRAVGGSSLEPNFAKTSSATTIDERVQRDLATSEPSISSVGGPELGSIAESSDAQVAQLTQMVGLLQKMLIEMQPSSSSGNAAGGVELASMNQTPKKPINTYSLTTGQYAQIAGKNIQNTSPTV